jgi:hypothetical protein
MATKDEHIQQWKHNRAFLTELPPSYPDWLVTVAFYAALHAVDSILAHDRVARINSHDARNDVLYRTNRYSAIQLKYQPLYTLSRTVRYLANPSAWVAADQVQKNVVERYLYPVERSVQRLMGTDLGLPSLTLRTPAASPSTGLGSATPRDGSA